MNVPDIEIVTPKLRTEFDDLRVIFREYAASLDVDLCFQNFEAEVASLPGDYAAPRGCLVMARVNRQLAGCCALRPLDTVDYPNACEMKRLYVRPAFRGLGLGRLLAESVMQAARMNAYDHVLLDTLDDMQTARSLYEGLGFGEIPPYYFNPIAGAHYLMARLNM